MHGRGGARSALAARLLPGLLGLLFGRLLVPALRLRALLLPFLLLVPVLVPFQRLVVLELLLLLGVEGGQVVPLLVLLGRLRGVLLVGVDPVGHEVEDGAQLAE